VYIYIYIQRKTSWHGGRVCVGNSWGEGGKEGLCRADVINATGRPSPFIPLWITPNHRHCRHYRRNLFTHYRNIYMHVPYYTICIHTTLYMYMALRIGYIYMKKGKWKGTRKNDFVIEFCLDHGGTRCCRFWSTECFSWLRHDITAKKFNHFPSSHDFQFFIRIVLLQLGIRDVWKIYLL